MRYRLSFTTGNTNDPLLLNTVSASGQATQVTRTCKTANEESCWQSPLCVWNCGTVELWNRGMGNWGIGEFSNQAKSYNLYINIYQ